MWHVVRFDLVMHRHHSPVLTLSPRRSALVLSVLMLSALTLSATSRAEAQLLERASSAVRDEPQSSSNNQSDDDDDDDGRLARGSRTVRGSTSRGSPRRHWDSGSPYCDVPAPFQTDLGPTGTDLTSPPEGGLLHLTTRLALEGGVVLPADPVGVGRVGASMRVQFPIGLEIGVRYSIFIEPRSGRTDSLALGRIGLDWRLVTEEFMQFRLGAAVRHFHDRAGDLYGADLEAGLDFFPVDPLILSFEANIGFVENALVVQARGSLGFLLGVVEVTLGWNYEGLFGSQNVDLGGPMVGARFWL